MADRVGNSRTCSHSRWRTLTPEPIPDALRRHEELEATFQALAHPARRQILLHLHFLGGELAAGQIAQRFSCKWPTITRHLAVLADAGLLTVFKVSRSRVYRLERDRLKAAREWLGWFER